MNKRANLLSYYVLTLRNAHNFRDRSGRKEFLVNCLINLLIMVVAKAISQHVLINLIMLFCTLPTIALNCRRLHDTGRTSLWIFLPVISIAILSFAIYAVTVRVYGWDFYGLVLPPLSLLIFVVYLFIVLRKGTLGPNRFGASQLAV